MLLLCGCLLCFIKGVAQTIPSIGRDNTIEIANWNLEWFGKTSNGFGPDNDALQQSLVLNVIAASSIDIWALCEVSEKKAFDSMMLKLPNYQSVLANYQPEQKTALIFNKNIFTLASFSLLGTENKDSFSTLRFPLEVVLLPNSNIGIDTLFLIILHLKANTGTDSTKMLAYNSRKRSSEWIRMYLDKTHSKHACIVLGDWNDDLDKSIYNSLPSPFVNLQTQNYPFKYISKKFTDAGMGTTTGYTDAIDHQLLSSKLYNRHIKDSIFIWKLDKYIQSYALNCSDHYPVYSLYNNYSSSLENQFFIQKISLFPNPVSDNFSIQNCPNHCILNVYNANGNLIYSDLDYSGTAVSTTTFREGIYFIHLTNGQNIFTFNCSILR